MNRMLLPAGLLAATSAVLVTSTATAVAAAPARPVPVAGYQHVVSQIFTQPPGGHDIAFVSCPDGTNVIGGGAVLFNARVGEQSIQDSNPSPNGQGFAARVNNESMAHNNSFRLYAVCASGIANYSVVAGTESPHPAGTQATADVMCPTGTVPFTGGGGSSLNDLTVSTNSSYPLRHGWRVQINNAGTDDLTVSATVACGSRPEGYQQVAGNASILKGYTQGSASAQCPTGTKVFGGGANSGAESLSVNLDATAPASPSTWQVYENNDIARTSTLIPWVVCGRATAAS